MDSWTDRIGSSRLSGPVTSPPLGVMDVRHRLQLGGLLLGRSVVEKVPASDFGAGEVLEQSRLAQRRMNLDVKVKAWIRAIGGRLVQHHDVGKRHPPQVVEPDQRLSKHGGEITQLLSREVGETRAGGAWSHERLVGVTCEIGNERQCVVSAHQESPAVGFLGLYDLRKQRSSLRGEVLRLRLCLRL